MRDLQRLLAEDVLRVLHGKPPRCPVADPGPDPGTPRGTSRPRAANGRPGGELASPGPRAIAGRSTRAAPLQSSTRRRRSALAITETELKVIAALATIGLSRRPRTG